MYSEELVQALIESFMSEHLSLPVINFCSHLNPNRKLQEATGWGRHFSFPVVCRCKTIILQC